MDKEGGNMSLEKISEVGLEKLGHYTADAAVVWCFDRRCRRAFLAFIEILGYKLDDLIEVAGGARELTLEDDDSHTAYVLEQLAISVTTHKAKEIVLMAHEDCAMYRQTPRAGLSETDFLSKELRRAKERVSRSLSGKFSGSIRAVMVTRQGTFEVV